MKKEEKRVYDQKWYQKNKQKVLHREKTKTLTKRRAIIEFYTNGENKCQHCGFNNWDCLVIDHKNNDGAKDRMNNPKRSHSMWYKQIIETNFPPDFQILCHNCNYLKELKRRKQYD